MRLNPGVPGGIPPINVRVGDTDWQNKLGWNAGGGASIGWRRIGSVLRDARDWVHGRQRSNVASDALHVRTQLVLSIE